MVWIYRLHCSTTRKLKQIHFPNLICLHLSGNPNISSFENVSFPAELVYLYLKNISMSAEQILSLKRSLGEDLEGIELDNTDLHGQMDALNEWFADLDRLERLSLKNCNLSSSDYEKLWVASLRELILSENSNVNISSMVLPDGLHTLEWLGVSWDHQQLDELNFILPDALHNSWIENYNQSDPEITQMRHMLMF